MNRFQYLLQFFRDPKVAAVGPTSKKVVEEVCRSTVEDRDLDVLELGPGDGVITRCLLDRLSQGSRIMAVESNPRFCHELEALEDPRLTVVEGKGQDFRDRMEKEGFKAFDRVVSGIPSSMLSHQERFQLMMDLHRMSREGGRTVIYQLSPLMKRYLKNFMEFEDMEIRMNGILPMFIMKGRKRYSKDPVEREKGEGPSDR